ATPRLVSIRQGLGAAAAFDNLARGEMMDAASVAVDVGEALVGGPVGIVAALSDFVPGLIGYLAGPKAGAVATQAVEVAKAVTGTQTGDAALSALRASPDLVLKYQELMQAKFLQVEKDAHEERMAQIAADQANVQAAGAQLAQVNETQREALKDRKFSGQDLWWWVSGLSFGGIAGLVCYIAFNAVWGNHFELLGQIPPLVGSVTALFSIPAVMLGVQSSIVAYHSGVADRITAGEQRTVSK
ncbi:MAG: hypothetical protein KGH75_14170, partial [Rhodospirillales bacterium]|nr:hypothetical protein [Rhodospirillales bacterium]